MSTSHRLAAAISRARLPIVAVVLAALLLSIASVPAATQASVLELSADRSLLVVRDGKPIELTVDLREGAELRLEARDFDGRLVRRLHDGPLPAGTHAFAWRGRDEDGRRVPRGPYRIVAHAESAGSGAGIGDEEAETWVTVADRAVYPVAPELITVAVDPGHGGSLSGAVGADGTREADLNLDIGLRLARMLEAAGVNVVITRTTDAFVNEPPEERTGDGIVDDDDELAARPDLANQARADLFISIHNNIAVNESVGGPSTFYFDGRTFGDRNARLARIVQAEMVAALAEAVPGDWEPYDHGTLVYPYYVLRDYDPPRLRRPTQMPGVLSEGMFLSNPRELRLLKRPAVRAAMAAAYYDAIAAYLARRTMHVGYELVAGPAQPVVAGDDVTFSVEVRNQGTERMRGWLLAGSAVPAPSRYIGRLLRGRPVGETRIPRLGPGQRTVLEISVAAPEPGGEWMLLFDARDRDGRRAARSGSPMLQVPLTTLSPPEPDASALPEPTETPAVVRG